MKKNEEETTRRDLQGQIEAILFAAGKPMGLDTIAILTGARRGSAKKALQTLKEQYDKKGGALFLFEEGENWKFSVKERFSPLIRKIVPETELSKSILETLAIIAWKSPISQADLVKIRSTKVYDHVPQLEESGCIVKERKGRTYQLKVTQKFYDYFELEGHDQIRQVFHNIPEQQQEKAKIREMRKEIRKEMLQQQSVAAFAAQDGIGPSVPPAPAEGSAENAASAALSDNPSIPHEQLPDPDDDMEDFLKKIDEKIDTIAQSHETIEMKRETYGFEQQTLTQETQPSPSPEQEEDERQEQQPQEETHKMAEPSAQRQEQGAETQEMNEAAAPVSADEEYDKRLAEKMRIALQREKTKQEQQQETQQEPQKPTRTQTRRKILDQLQQLKEKPKRLSALRRRK